MIQLRLIFVTCLLFNFINTSQATTYADSLELTLKTATDTTRINILNKLSTAFCESNSTKALDYAYQAIELSW